MNQKNQNSKLIDQLVAIQELLVAETFDGPTMCEVAAELGMLAEMAHEIERVDVELAAACLSQLAENTNQITGSQRSDVVEFIIMNVLLIDEFVDDPDSADELSRIPGLANSNWPKLNLLTIANPEPKIQSQPASHPTREGDGPKSEDESLESQQIQLMLAALAGTQVSAAESESFEENSMASVTTSKPSSPVKESKSKQKNSKRKKSKPNPSQSQPTQTQSRQKETNSAKPPVESDKLLETDKLAEAGQTPPAQTLSIPKPPEHGDEDARKMLIDDPILLEAWLDDALRCLGSMEQCAIQLESTPDETSSVQQFCRELHTMKGASASVGLGEFAAYLHELESALEEVFEQSANLDVDALFLAVDHVRQLVDSLQGIETDSQPIVTESNDTPAAAATVKNPVSPPARKLEAINFSTNDEASVRVRASKLDRLMDMLAELVVLRNRRESHATEFNELNRELARCSARIGLADEQWRNEAVTGVNERSVANMTEVAKDIEAVSSGLRNLQKPVNSDNAAISRFIGAFRQELMQLRRVPVSGLFNRLQRAARDAAKSEDKKVTVKLMGENSGLEQEIQEKLFESLLHVVRNSVSHGIETPSDRKKAGKDPVGHVELEASSNAQLLVIEVRDDGGGINYGAIKKRATEKGLIGPMDNPTENQLGKLIFHPGFSTRQTASTVSGRGVGMDIVATTMDQLRGRIEVESVSGQGTTMRFLIPLRTGIEHVMLFRAGGQIFALPMQSVTAAKSSQSNVHFDLKSVLGINVNQASSQSESAKKSDVIKIRSHQAGQNQQSGLTLGVDELLGPEEVVVRGLPNILKNHPLFSGVTLCGSGEKVLLLDSEALVAYCDQCDDSLQSEDKSAADSEGRHPHRKSALIVDDSLTARKVLAKILRTQGFSVVESGDGIEAIEKLHKSRFDLVLTDLDMPRMGGLELLSDIQTGQYCDAITVVVSSRNEMVFRDKAIEVGAHEFINKPASEKSIIELLEKLQLLPESVEG
ncbi:MAG: response regulator [Planctomycetota bacterium]